jgi:hypothetical protein
MRSIAPDVLALSQYVLAIKGLKDGDYLMKINGVTCGRFTSKQLADGINLTALAPLPMTKDVNPVVAQMRVVLKAVADKEALVSSWRGLSQKVHAKGADPKLKDELAALTTKVEEADAKIRDVAKPQKLRFEIVPVPTK